METRATREVILAGESKEKLDPPRRKTRSGGRQQKRNLEREEAQEAKNKSKRTECLEVASVSAAGLETDETTAVFSNTSGFQDVVAVVFETIAKELALCGSGLSQDCAYYYKGKMTSLNTRVLKVTSTQQAKGQLLSKSTVEHLEVTMHWLITSLLYKTTQNHSEIERHLNLLKKRFLNSFETLQVPVEKLSGWKNVHTILAKEKKKSVAIEEGLEELQKELDKVLQAAESINKNIESFQNSVLKLKCELAAEEAAASKLFQRDYKDDLALPDISENCLKAPTLQNELLKVRHQQVLLNDLNTIQQSEEMKTVSTFLEQVYETMDF